MTQTLPEKSMMTCYRILPTFSGVHGPKENWNAATSKTASVTMPCIGVTAVDMRTACRSHSEACDHHICNYSSELGEQFVPASTAAKNSTFNIADIVYDTLGQEAHFGSQRSEQSDFRRPASDDLIDKRHEGTKAGNSYNISSVLSEARRRGVSLRRICLQCAEQTTSSDLKEHSIEYQDPDTPLPIWRPPILINCKHHGSTEDECYDLVELYRSAFAKQNRY